MARWHPSSIQTRQTRPPEPTLGQFCGRLARRFHARRTMRGTVLGTCSRGPAGRRSGAADPSATSGGSDGLRVFQDRGCARRDRRRPDRHRRRRRGSRERRGLRCGGRADHAGNRRVHDRAWPRAAVHADHARPRAAARPPPGRRDQHRTAPDAVRRGGRPHLLPLRDQRHRAGPDDPGDCRPRHPPERPGPTGPPVGLDRDGRGRAPSRRAHRGDGRPRPPGRLQACRRPDRDPRRHRCRQPGEAPPDRRRICPPDRVDRDAHQLPSPPRETGPPRR